MKLSKKAWNNVILLSALVLILVFNITGQSLNKSEQVVGILPDNAEILALSIGQQLWKKTEDGWLNRLNNNNNPHINKTIKQWQEHKFTPWPDAVGGNTQIKRIKVQIAQLANPIDLNLFYSQEIMLVTNWQGQLLKLSQEEFDLLFSPLIATVH